MGRSLVELDPVYHQEASDAIIYVTDHVNYYGSGKFHRTPDCHVLKRRCPKRINGSTWQFPIIETLIWYMPSTIRPCRVCYPPTAEQESNQ